MLANFDGYKGSVTLELNAQKPEKGSKRAVNQVSDEERFDAYGTSLGGAITLAIYLFGAFFLFLQIRGVLQRKYDYSFERTYMSTKELGETELKLNDFNASFNFILYSGAKNVQKSFDLLNNDYVDVQVELFDESAKYTTGPHLKMKYCTEEEKMRVYQNPSGVMSQALCLNNREVSIKGGGLGQNPESFRALQINIVACQNTTENGNKCRSKEEIEKFVAIQNFYFEMQRTEVVPSMFEDHRNVQEWPHLGNKDKYYPTLRLAQSIILGRTIGWKWGGPYQQEQVKVSVNTLNFDDSLVSLRGLDNSREFKYVNAGQIRSANFAQTSP